MPPTLVEDIQNMTPEEHEAYMAELNRAIIKRILLFVALKVGIQIGIRHFAKRAAR